MKKGFIGPIGDDLPSIVALMLALGLFFTSLIYTFDTYNQKISNMEVLKGSIEIGRALLSKGVMTEDDILNNANAKFIATSYDLTDYKVFLDEVDDGECEGAYRFNYLVATISGGDVELRKLILCTWK